jgi:P-type conjugative transfer protein TrbG
MKFYTFALLIALSSVSAYGLPEENPDDKYFTGIEPPLTPQEEEGIAIAKGWKASSGKGIKPAQGPDGSINFLFGASQPSIVCAVLQVCDIELQPGEQVNSIHLGDAARWTIEPAITGFSDNEVQHLIIKPLDVALNTSLIVTTNRRTYHLRLRSTRNDYMARVTFTYTDDAMKKWENSKTHMQQEHNQKIIPETGEYLGNLDFKYKIDGSGNWKPLRVYNDGKKTILEMPATMSQTDAPTLLVVRKDGGVFSDDEQAIVNYRVQNDRYIVDNLFDKAILISGVGSSQTRVTITREQ